MSLRMNEEDFSFFINRIYGTIDRNKDVRDVISELQKKDNNVTVLSVLNGFEEYIKKLQSKEKKAKDPVTDSMLVFLSLVKQIREVTSDLVNGYDPEKREINKQLLPELIKAAASAVKDEKVLDKFFEKYGYYEYRRRDVKLLVGLAQGIVNAREIIESKDRELEVNIAAGQIEKLEEDEQIQITAEKDLINSAQKEGIDFDEIEFEAEKRKDNLTRLEAQLEFLNDDKANEELRQNYNNEIARLEKAAADDTQRITELEQSIDAINTIGLMLKTQRNTVKAAEDEYEEQCRNLKNLENSFSDTKQQIESELAKIDESEEIDRQISEMLEDPEKSKVIDMSEASPERLTLLSGAFDTMQTLASLNVDVYYLIDKTEGWTKFDGLTNDEKTAVNMYLGAKNDVINNYSDDPNNTEAKDYFKALESESKDRYMLQHRFLGEFGAKLKSQCLRIESSVSETLNKPENQKLLSDYHNLRARRKANMDASTKVGVLFETKNRIEAEIAAQKKNMEKNRRLMEEFASFAKKTYGKQVFENTKIDDVIELNRKLYEKANGNRNSILTSDNYRTFLSKKEKLNQKIFLTESADRKVRAAKLLKDVENARTGYNVAKGLNDRREVLKSSFNELNERHIEINKNFRKTTVEKQNGVERIQKRLDYIYNNILKKSKNNPPKKSPEFTELYNALENARDKFTRAVNGAVDVEDLKNTMNTVKAEAEKYLEKKSKQWSPWLFTSEQRSVRKMFARELVNLCEPASFMLQRLTKNDLTVMRYFQKKERSRYLDAEFEFRKQLKGRADEMKLGKEKKKAGLGAQK